LNKALIVIGLCTLIALIPESPVRATASGKSPSSSAKDLAREGLKLARTKQFKAAAQRFEAAFKLDPQAIYAHNLARSFEELGELTKAFDFFSQALRLDSEYNYAAEGRRKIGALEKRLRKTHGRIKITTTPTEVGLTLVETGEVKTQHLRSPHLRWVKPGSLTIKAEKLGFTERITVVNIVVGRTQSVGITLKPIPKKGYLNVSSSHQGTRVRLDGRDVGKAPIKGMVLEAGNHRVTLVTGKGDDATTLLEKDIVIVPDKSFTISFNLQAQDSPETSTDWLPTSLWITGGALCLASIGMHIAAADRIASIADYPILDVESVDKNRPDYESLRQQIKSENDANQAKADEARTSGQSLELAAWIGYGAAVSTAVVATILYMQGVDNPLQSTAKEVPSLTLVPTMNVGIDRSTFGLSISF